MALIVETGAIIAGAESYISVTDADTYFSNRGNTTWAALTTTQKEQALRKATDHMMQVYRQRWKGTRMNFAQTLDWPRAYVYLEPVVTGANQEFPNLVPDNIVPVEVKTVCAEYAVRSSSGVLSADLGQARKRVKVGPIETEYDEFSTQSIRYGSLDAALAPYFSLPPGSLKVVRT